MHYDLSILNEQLPLELHGISLSAQHNDQKDWPINNISKQIVRQCYLHILQEYGPLVVCGNMDSNCLYHAHSLDLYGDEMHHVH